MNTAMLPGNRAMEPMDPLQFALLPHFLFLCGDQVTDLAQDIRIVDPGGTGGFAVKTCGIDLR